MTEHLSNGQFAKKEVTEGSSRSQNKETCRIGTGKRGPGRPKGSPNKLTRAAKDFLAELCEDTEVQAAVKGRILKGDAVAFFRALEHVLGKPKENVDLNITGSIQVEQRLVSGRQRVAAARGK